jgi:hypothetical protein
MAIKTEEEAEAAGGERDYRRRRRRHGLLYVHPKAERPPPQ